MKWISLDGIELGGYIYTCKRKSNGIMEEVKSYVASERMLAALLARAIREKASRSASIWRMSSPSSLSIDGVLPTRPVEATLSALSPLKMLALSGAVPEGEGTVGKRDGAVEEREGAVEGRACGGPSPAPERDSLKYAGRGAVFPTGAAATERCDSGSDSSDEMALECELPLSRDEEGWGDKCGEA